VVIPSLKHFKFIDQTTEDVVTVASESMLTKNSTLEHLHLGDSTMSPTRIEELLRPFTDAQGVSLGPMLAKNSTLEHLDLGDFSMSSNAIEALLEPLSGASGQLPVNTSLKHISVSSVSKDNNRPIVAQVVAAMFTSNKTLTHFNLALMSSNAIQALLEPLTSVRGQLPLNTSLKHISVSIVSKDDNEEPEEVQVVAAQVVAAMLTSNKTLTHLNLAGYVFSKPSDVCMVLQSLWTNESLQTLDLVGCDSDFEWEEDVFAEMLQLIQENPYLKSIKLPKGKIGEGYIEAVKAQLAANAIKRSGTKVENLPQKALHNPMNSHFLDEIEVAQEILECKPSDSLENGLDNLEVSPYESKSMTRFLDFQIAIKMNQLRL